MKKLILLFAIIAISLGKTKAQIQIHNSYFDINLPSYLWDIGGSPYLIMEDIKIPNGSDLMIEPGVEILFQGHYKIDVKGSINAIGTSDDRIVFTSDEKNPWNGIRFNFSDNPNPAPSKLHCCDISYARKTGTICTSPDPESSGGAIYIESFSDLEIHDCKIFKNSVLGHGGAISIFSSSNPSIEECSIHNNYAEHRGGGLCIMRGSSPDVQGNNLYDNESEKGGGAIYIGNFSGNSSNPDIIGNTMLNNSTSGLNGLFGEGGGVYICNSNPTVSGNTFDQNSAFSNGGGVYIQGSSNVILEYNNFFDNQSSDYGGGLYCTATLTNPIDYCQFSGNSAVNGGGIYLYQSELDVTNCTFTTNTTSTHGGGIYVLESISTIENCIFEENTATANGGGIFMDDPLASQYITPSSINLNKFKLNTASQGSALYIFRESDPLISTSYQYSAKVLNNLFVENHSIDKGVVYMQGDNINTIFNHNTVSNNTATYMVSGICVEKDAYFPLVNANNKNFYNNIIHEPFSVVDILIIYTYTHPTNYSTLTNVNCLQSNPNFVSSADYHLSSSSICIDAGNNLATKTITDLDGNQRIYNGTTDYGCFEYNSAPPPIQPIRPFQSGLNNNSDNKIDVKTFPNPASDVLNISIDGESIVNVSIFDINGRKVYDTGIVSINNTLEIAVNSLLPGSYFISVQLENEIVNKKILIQ